MRAGDYPPLHPPELKKRLGMGRRFGLAMPRHNLPPPEPPGNAALARTRCGPGYQLSAPGGRTAAYSPSTRPRTHQLDPSPQMADNLALGWSTTGGGPLRTTSTRTPPRPKGRPRTLHHLTFWFLSNGHQPQKNFGTHHPRPQPRPLSYFRRQSSRAIA